jgi:hypothetical protein
LVAWGDLDLWCFLLMKYPVGTCFCFVIGIFFHCPLIETEIYPWMMTDFCLWTVRISLDGMIMILCILW